MEGINRKIGCFDLFAFQGIHSSFNVGMLHMIYKAFNNEINTIEFFSESQLNNIVHNRLKDSEIIFTPLKELDDIQVGGKKTIIRDLKACRCVRKAFRSDKTDLFFFLAYPLSLLYICFLSCFHKRKKIYIVMHGEIEVFVKDSNFYRNKFYYSLPKRIFKNTRLLFILLGNSIYNNVDFLFKKKPIIINHPIELNTVNNLKKTNDKTMNVIMIGTGDRSKGADKFIKIANSFTQEIEKGEIQFEIVGKLAPDIKAEVNNNIKFHDNILSVKDYNMKIENADLVLLLKDNSLKAVASGTFLDALAYGIPFLSIKNSYVEYYANDFLMENCIFDSTELIARKLKELLIMPIEDRVSYLEKCKNNILQIREAFSIEKNSKIFMDQIQ